MRGQLDRVERDLSVTAETIALFVRYYLTITPPLPSGDQDAARALGRERFEMFVAQVGKASRLRRAARRRRHAAYQHHEAGPVRAQSGGGRAARFATSRS
jgi:hypothetical protein